MGTAQQADADWGEDDDDFLCAVDWDAQEERVHSGVGTSVRAEEGAAEQHRRPTGCTTGFGLSLRGVFGQVNDNKQRNCTIDLTCGGDDTGGLAKEEAKPRELNMQGDRLPMPDEGQCAVKVSLLAPDGEDVDIMYPFVMFHVSNSRNAKVLQVFRDNSLCSWSQKKKCWKCPAKSYVQVMRQLKQIKYVHTDGMAGVPSSVLKAALELRDDSMRYSHIPDELEEKLMQFQRSGVKFALRHGGRCLLGDEMGLGKTVQALAVASAYRDEWPVLVVAPSSMRESWADSIESWLQVPNKRIRVINTGKDVSATIHGSVDFLIISYNFLDKMDLQGKYNIVVVDESHYLKDISAKRTKAALPILKASKRCILLTGTPALNRPKEIFTQLTSLLPKASLKLKDFGERYCTGNRFDKYGGAKNLEELHALLRGSVMIRRLKSGVLTQLPKKRRQQIFLSLDEKFKKELSKLQEQMQDSKIAIGQLIAQHAASGGLAVQPSAVDRGIIMEVYRKTADLKAKAVQDYVDTLLEGGGKFLIFAHHVNLLDSIEHCCNRKKGCKYIRIDGATPPTVRSGLVESFQKNEDVRVAILSIRAAGVGLTLTAASTVVFAEMTWTPGEIIQAEDRAHRIGQLNSVNVYFLHVKNSIDDIIWSSIQNKLEKLGQTLDGMDQTLEVCQSRIMPEKGQQSLDKFLTPSQQPIVSQAVSQNIDITSKSPETRTPKRKNFDI
eukprot:jgi/Picsp_1/1445/NSC_04924-R1_swi snf-related matrix-associated actin-dependent regulator of chromatin subfamily a-like protein 1-like